MATTGSGRALLRYGSWAMVTGSTAGIGRAFASELAAAGFNVALLARDAGQLQAQCRELASAWDIEAVAIPCDLGKPDYLPTITAATDALPIAFFVNNAGAASYHGRFLERSAQDMARMDQALLELDCTVGSLAESLIERAELEMNFEEGLHLLMAAADGRNIVPGLGA